MKYRKKPVVVEAIQFTQNNFPQIKEFTNGLAYNFDDRDSRGLLATCIIPPLKATISQPKVITSLKALRANFTLVNLTFLKRLMKRWVRVDVQM